MALYHVHVKNISRADGASALAASAYRAGARLVHDITGQSWDYRRKKGIVFSRVLLPDGAPDWMDRRAQLWNAVEARERRKDARLAKEIEIALPCELSPSQQIELALAYGDMLRQKGLVVDLAVHNPKPGHNPHVHLLVTTRAIAGEGFAGKLRELDKVAFVHEIRSRWTAYGNAALAAAGRRGDLDHRSYAERGIGRIPQKHRLRRWTRERTQRQARLERQRELAQYRKRFYRYDLPERTARTEPITHRRLTPALVPERREPARVISLERMVMDPKQSPPGVQPESEAGQGTRPVDPRYPLLSQRPDWPPQTHVPARDMSRQERLELLNYWREKRQEELLHEQRPEPEECRTERVRDVMKAVREERAAETRPTTRSALPRPENDRDFAAFQARTDKEILDRWPELRAVRAEQERREADKYRTHISQDEREDSGIRVVYETERPGPPPETFEERRAREAAAITAAWKADERHPVPDPDGNPISPSERDRAEERMLNEHYDRHRSELDTPCPEALSQRERDEAQERLREEHEREDRDERDDWEERRR